MAKKAKEYLLYEGKPLLRDGNVLYYGDFSENFITRFTITETKKVQDLEVASKVTIELLEKHGNDISTARLTKKAERDSLFAALDIGVYWLEDILEMEKDFLQKAAQ
ncbi:MAG: pyridoxamine 5'-phosphate oxidase family protein [Clostridia bacterium]|nr:pyridoxamine 5'-phosphate oxidase family protein [Clostridia bacterium]